MNESMKNYVQAELTKGLKKFGWTDEELEIMASDYVYNVLEQYGLEDMPLNIKEFLDVRLVDLVADYIKGNVLRYPVLNEDGDLNFVLETKYTRGEVDAILHDFAEEVEMDFVRYMENEGVVVIGGFERAITLA